MLKFNFLPSVRVIPYANDLIAFVPEFWANESIRILENNMVMPNLIHQDFSNIVARAGQTVHTRQPC